MDKKRQELIETELKDADFQFSQNFEPQHSVISDTTAFPESDGPAPVIPMFRVYKYRYF